MIDDKIRNLKRAQKQSLIRKEFSKLFLDVKLNEPAFERLYISKVELSADKSTAFVLFYTDEGQDNFNDLLRKLILYKPSMRSALAKLLQSRYTPQLVFKYDQAFEKQTKIENLLNEVRALDPLIQEKEAQKALELAEQEKQLALEEQKLAAQNLEDPDSEVKNNIINKRDKE